jgi:hypothetical protein
VLLLGQRRGRHLRRGARYWARPLNLTTPCPRPAPRRWPALPPPSATTAHTRTPRALPSTTARVSSPTACPWLLTPRLYTRARGALSPGRRARCALARPPDTPPTPTLPQALTRPRTPARTCWATAPSWSAPASTCSTLPWRPTPRAGSASRLPAPMVSSAPPPSPCQAGRPGPGSCSCRQAALGAAPDAGTCGPPPHPPPPPAGLMAPADAVLGWVDDGTATADVSAYEVRGYTLGAHNKVSGWAYNLAVAQSAAGVTTICFSRPPNAPDTNISPQLDPKSGAPRRAARRRRGRRCTVQLARPAGPAPAPRPRAPPPRPVPAAGLEALTRRRPLLQRCPPTSTGPTQPWTATCSTWRRARCSWTCARCCTTPPRTRRSRCARPSTGPSRRRPAAPHP